MSTAEAPSVLVVDDDYGTRETVADTLTVRGYRVATATQGRDALATLGQAPFDGAVVDIRLPDITGLDLLQEIKRVSPDTEVIFITGYASLPTAIQAINGAAFAYLIKPFEMDTLLASLGRAVEKRELILALRESEERYRLVTEHISDAVLLCDVEGRPLMGNGRVRELTGYSAGELVGRRLTSLFSPEGAAAFQTRLDAVRTRREGPRPFEAGLVRRDRTAVTAEVSVTAVVQQGRVVGNLAVFRDVTERRRLEQELRQAQKMEAIGRLAGGVAHDFNNLLTIIGGEAELMLDTVDRDAALRAPLETVVRTAQRAAGLTQQLLAFSRRQILQPRVLDLNAALVAVEPLLRRLVPEDIELVARLAPGLAHVTADPGQIEQVVMNLVVNARDALPRGGRITVSTANVDVEADESRLPTTVPAGRYVALTVEDTGVGIPAALLPQIFEPFFTTKGPSQGTGLGLSTVYGIVKQSGGHVTVDSAVGRGSVFTVFLPRTEDAAAATAGAETQLPRGGSETILLVEDEAGVRDLARQTLQRQGYTVLEAADAAAALERVARHPGPIDLLLTDVVLPGMSGRELADRLAVERPGILTLFMSGYTDDSIVHHGVRTGDTAFLQKPFSPQGLAGRVRDLLDQP
jgi:PAS domain S-box-containing protein